MKISVIIPMYNEASIINESIPVFTDYLKAHFDDFELIFSDDGSTDNCGQAVTEYSEKDPRVKLSRYEKNRGKGCAVRTGVLKSTGDIVLFTDCDIAYGVDVIERIAVFFKENPDKDVVVGSRNISKDGYEGYTVIRKLASKIYIKVLNIVAGFRLSDSQCGLKGFRGDAARKIFSVCETDRFAFDFEVLMVAAEYGYKIGELPVKVINHRESKVHVFSDSLQMLSDLCRIKKSVKAKKLNKIK